MRDEIGALYERLLARGVSPKWARRYRDELDDHLADLTEALMAEGHDVDTAMRMAQQRMGSFAALEAAVAVDARALSLTARLPLLYVAAPVLGLMGVIAAIAALLVLLAPALEPIAWLPKLSEAAGPAVIAWLVAMAAWRRRARPGWPLGGMIATLGLGALLDLDLTLPSAEQAGAIAVALGGPDPGMLLASLLATLPAFLLLNSRLKAI